MNPIIVPLITAALCGALVHLIARVWNPRQLFFVNLGRDVSAADRRRSRRAIAIGWAGSAASVAATLVWPDATGAMASAILITVAVSWPLVELLMLLPTLDRPALPGRIQVDLDDQPGPTALLSIPLVALEAGLLLASLAVLAHLWPALPEQVPLHFDATGTPDRYGAPTELLVMWGIVLFDMALTWLIAFTVSRERPALPEREPERYAELQRGRRFGLVRMTQTLLFGVNLGLLALGLGIAISSLPSAPIAASTAALIGLVVVALGCIAPLVWWIPRLSALRAALDALGGTEIGTRKAGWKLGGLVYFAPDDPAIFVPKRVGMGQTLNMGRAASWLALVLLVGVPLGLTGVAVWLAG